jgi:hypothetical protein
MINEVKLDGVNDRAIPDLETCDRIKKSIIHSDAVVYVTRTYLKKFNKIYRIFQKHFFYLSLLQEEFAAAYTTFIKYALAIIKKMKFSSPLKRFY